MKYFGRAALVLLTLTTGTGCYRYVAGDYADVSAGSQVRVTLTPEQAMRMRSILATGDTLVEGTVLNATPDRLEVRVPGLQLAQQRTTDRLYQTVAVERADMTSVQFRELDRTRTVLVAVGAPLLAGAIVAGIWEWTHSTVEPEFPGGDESRIPIMLRVPFPFGRQ